MGSDKVLQERMDLHKLACRNRICSAFSFTVGVAWSLSADRCYEQKIKVHSPANKDKKTYQHTYVHVHRS
jgi:hypothetical protein